MKDYKEFRIDSIPFNADILSSLLWEIDIMGINEYDNYLLAYAEDDSTVSAQSITEQLQKLVTNNLIETFSVNEEILENKNWNEEWEKKINVIEVGNKIVVKPSFKPYNIKPGQIILHIDPKMSFGTGEHETTKLMLILTEKHTEKDMKVIDVGTGTGILAICAAKLGASKVVAIDNDEWCLLNGQENIERNELSDSVDIRLCEIANVKENDFDLVLANINRNILLEIANELSNRVKSGGKILLSGLLREDETAIIESYLNHDLKYFETIYLNEWAALVFIKQ